MKIISAFNALIWSSLEYGYCKFSCEHLLQKDTNARSFRFSPVLKLR